MMIPTWSPFVAGIAAYFFYWLGRFRGERVERRRKALAAASATAPIYNVTLTLDGHGGVVDFEKHLRAALDKIRGDAVKVDPS